METLVGKAQGANITPEYEPSSIIIDGEEYSGSLNLVSVLIDMNVSLLPYNFYSGCAVVYNNEIHLLGSSAPSSSNYTSHYKWNGSSWTEVSTLPYPFYRGSTVVYNNEIHLLGGSGDRTAHYKWNGSIWESVSKLPYAYYSGSNVVYKNDIHILGGSSFKLYHYRIHIPTYMEPR